MQFAFLMLGVASILGCESGDLSSRTVSGGAFEAETDDDVLVLLATPAADEVWDQSAKSTAHFVADCLSREQLSEATGLTKQALALPRHPDRNDHFGWGHATMSLSLLLDGLVKAERWDDLIEIGLDSAAKVGNEYVESQRIRAMALAHWKKRQFKFRSRLLIKELEGLEKSLNARMDEYQDWNEINSPEDLIEIDWAFVEATKKHIKSSVAFIEKLEQAQPSADVAVLRKGYLESKLEVPYGEQKALSAAEDRFGELGLHPTAPDFRLGDDAGNTFSLSETGGRGTLVVFYLGRTCFHCAMQLKEFAPRFEEFEQRGISILGVSQDTPQQLSKAVEAFNGRIPFTLWSDSEKKVFRQYGLIVDGQEDPLHGTFLIGQNGEVLWYDVDADPFLDISFLLQESDRLLDRAEGSKQAAKAIQ